MNLRIAIVVTHLLGVGHLSRAATLARALAQRGHKVVLLSGGQPAPLLRAQGVQLVQLPPVHVNGTAFSDLREDGGAPLQPETAQRRIAMACAALQDLQPHVLVTELFPFGRRVLGAEFRAILAAAEALPTPPMVLASVRDILARPDKQAKIDAAHALLRAHYDGVLAHSDPEVVPLEVSWPLAGDLSPLVHYTGYVDEAASGAPQSQPTFDRSTGDVIVSGGGSAAALPLLRAALDAAALDREQTWRLLAGHKIPQATFAALQAAAPPNALVERARPDFRALLRHCAVSVSQCGYNTALDILATGAPAVVIPFAEGGETEQSQRAALFAARGLVTPIAQEQLSPHSLLAAVQALRAENRRRNATQLDARQTIACDGAVRSAEIIERLARPAQPAPAVATLRITLDAVDDDLRRAADLGRPINFWWRDDDVTEPTPQLEQLLGLAAAHGAPLSLAAIPALAGADLAEFLAGRADVSVLPHGFSHENLAPDGVKKSEFGHGEGSALARRAGDGLARLQGLFGEQCQPVFTPPWNRINPELPPLLPTMGFAGLSTFRERPGQFAAPGLIQVNAHIDPINWREDRSLVEPARLASDLCAAISLRLGQPAGAPMEPVGLLTHHLVHDARIDAFVAAMLALVADHAGARWINIGAALDQAG